jgi:Putative papain-like cysteine peptidase (DUF1796)
MADDLHDGLSEDRYADKTIIFSVGHRCTSTSLIKEMKQKFETYPFDWVVSKLDVLVHCIETEFEEYLRVENYVDQKSETFNLCDDVKTHVCYENILYNKYYEEEYLPDKPENKIGTYGMKLAMTHHDIRTSKDYQYFQRCIQRFKKILSLSQQKFYLYVHPIMGVNDYDMQVTNGSLLNYFNAFTEYLKTKTANSFGIYFVVVKNESKKGSVEVLFETDDLIIYAMHTNQNLVDGGGVYDGDFYTEQYKMLITLENIIAAKKESFQNKNISLTL